MKIKTKQDWEQQYKCFSRVHLKETIWRVRLCLSEVCMEWLMCGRKGTQCRSFDKEKIRNCWCENTKIWKHRMIDVRAQKNSKEVEVCFKEKIEPKWKREFYFFFSSMLGKKKRKANNARLNWIFPFLHLEPPWNAFVSLYHLLTVDLGWLMIGDKR